jgi:hypothetical protein
MLIWKTDWTEQDNYARRGIEDMSRLINNYLALAARILAGYGVDVKLEAIALNGYSTIPFADFLNKIERNMARLYFQPLFTEAPKTVVWQPGERGPDCGDINRWETSGLAVDRIIKAQ